MADMVEKEGAVEAPVVNPDENDQGGAGSAKDQWLANVRAKYGNDLSEDELYAKVGQDFDAQRSYADGARNDRQKLQEAMMSNPSIAEFINSVAGGASVSEAAGAIEGDLPAADAENVAAMQAEAQRRAEAAEASVAKLNENLAQSKAVMEQYFVDNNISKDEADELTGEFMQKVAQPIAEGMITPETMTIIAKGLCYDKHRVKWEEAGRVAGRNDKIEEERKKFEEGMDGLPKGEAAAGIQKEAVTDRDAEWISSVLEKTKPHPFFDR